MAKGAANQSRRKSYTVQKTTSVTIAGATSISPLLASETSLKSQPLHIIVKREARFTTFHIRHESIAMYSYLYGEQTAENG